MHSRIPAVVTFLLLLQGCVTMTARDCQTADWAKVGFEDGVRGLQLSYLDAHVKTCGKHGVIPDDQAYETGYQAGIKVYCTPQNGYELGIAGKEYYNFCPDTVESQFLQEYAQGLEIKIQQLENDRRQYFRQIQTLQRNLSNAHNPETREQISNSLEFYEDLELETYEHINQLREWMLMANSRTDQA